MPGNNAARRLYETLLSATQAPHQVPAVDAWARVFKLESEGIDRAFDVVAGLALLRKQLHRVRDQMAQTKLPPETYLSQLQIADSVLNPVNLPAGWGGMVGNIRADVLAVINMCGGILGERETPLTSEEISKLKVRIVAIRSEIENSQELPQELSLTLLAQCDEMIRAINLYDVTGVEGLEAATEGMMMAMIRRQGQVQEYADNPAVRGFYDFTMAMWPIIEKVYKVSFLTYAGSQLWGSIAPKLLGP